MTTPLFAPNYSEPPDLTTQVSRMPGSIDAPCLCREPECSWPFCIPDEQEDE